MADRIEYPVRPGGRIEDQIGQMWRYLVRMADTLNRMMEEIGYAGLTDEDRKILRPVLGEEAINRFVSLKEMIVRTAAKEAEQTDLTGIESEIEEIRDETAGIEGSLEMELEETYSNWFTPASGITVSTCTLRKVTKNLFYVTMNLSKSSEFQGNGITEVGTIKKNYAWFGGKDITGLLPGRMINNSSNIYASTIQFMVNGTVNLDCLTSASCLQTYAIGFIIRRDV